MGLHVATTAVVPVGRSECSCWASYDITDDERLSMPRGHLEVAPAGRPAPLC